MATPPKFGTPPAPRQIKRPGPKPRMTKEETWVAVGLKTAGLPAAKVAQALDVDPRTVAKALSRVPNLYEQVMGYRDNLKMRKLRHLWDAEELLWTRIKGEIPQGQPKDVDALFRAAHAAEKIEAGMAGEAQKVEVTGSPAPQVDLKVLIQSLGLDGWDVVTKK